MDDGTSVLRPGEVGSTAGTARVSAAGAFSVGVLDATPSDRGGVDFVADRDTGAGAVGLAADSARVPVAGALTEGFEIGRAVTCAGAGCAIGLWAEGCGLSHSQAANTVTDAATAAA